MSKSMLFEDQRETVQLETWDAGADISIDLPEGGEFLVLAGGFEAGAERLRKHSWLRVPKGGHLNAVTGDQGAKVWIKTRHLRYVSAPQVKP